MRIFIRPTDTFFFRDGRPFDAGVDTVAKGIFPPFPATIYGALRSYILVQSNVDFKTFKNAKSNKGFPPEVGYPKGLGTLEICGPWLAERTIYEEGRKPGFIEYFPSPLNLVRNKDNKEELFFLMPDKRDTKGRWDLKSPLKPILPPEGIVVEPVDCFIPHTIAINLLVRNQLNAKDLTPSHELFKPDFRVGIARDYSKRTAKEGMLYSALHYQLNPLGVSLGRYSSIGLMVEVRPDSLTDKGYLQIGGESSSAVYEKIDTDSPFLDHHLDEVTEVISKKKMFYLWLVTPAIFKSGFLPDFVDENSLLGSLPLNSKSSIGVKLIACQVGRPVRIGGFDMVKKMPKGMLKAVPPGSIYFFSLQDGNIDKIRLMVKQLMLKPLPTKYADYKKQGFGISIIGGV